MTMVMGWDEWVRHDAVGLAQLVRQGDVTPAELAAQVAAGIAKLDPTLNAVVEVFADVVADPLKDGMRPDGAFAGVPYLMKDLGPTLKGRKQEMGAKLMQGQVASADSYLTGRIRQAGLNIMGRTTTPEFGTCGSAENPELYVTHNPWDVAYTAGGSSSGTGACVASGILPLSHASDGGGSIRIPAGINGNIGLKPSRGVFSAGPGGSDLTAMVSVQGCHTRTVRDTAAFVDACRGGAPGEFMPFWSAPETYADLIQRDPTPGATTTPRRTSSPSWTAPAASWRGWAITSTGRRRMWISARPMRRRPVATSPTARRTSSACRKRAATPGRSPAWWSR
jgi:amidase